MAIILTGGGWVFFLIGTVVGLWPLWRARRARRLREHGDLVLATLDRVALDIRISYNQRHPWGVHAHWVDPLTQRRHLFRSDTLWDDPGGRWDQQAIPVYIKRGQPTHYAMDLSAPGDGVGDTA